MENNNKRYDEALERARDFYEFCKKSGTKNTAEIILNIFPELRESKDERIRKMLIEFFGKGAENNCSTNGISDKDILAWLEKQGEQILANLAKTCKDEHKVKPKFHEGELVILTAGELSTTLQIVKVDTNKKLYWFNDSSYLPIVDEECLHLWSIKDAKDGDMWEAEKWLNSLKNKYIWKPSQEQMDALETAISSLQSTALESLYNELKKL